MIISLLLATCTLQGGPPLLHGLAQDPEPGLRMRIYTFGQTEQRLADEDQIARMKLEQERIDRQVNFDVHGEAFPGTGLKDTFFVRWTGLVRVPKEGRWTFTLRSDDGSKLWINGKQVVDNDGHHSMTDKSGEVDLKKGDHELRIDFFENGGDAGCILYWETNGVGRQVVPASALHHRKDGVHRKPAPVEAKVFRPGIVGNYFNLKVSRIDAMKGLPGDPKVKRVDRMVEHHHDSFRKIGFSENFFVRWQGFVRIPRAGKWRFFTRSNDGSRLYIGERQVVDNDGGHAEQERQGEVELEAGHHPIRIDFFQNGGGAMCVILWEGSGIPKQVIPASYLFHTANAFRETAMSEEELEVLARQVDRRKEMIVHREASIVELQVKLEKARTMVGPVQARVPDLAGRVINAFPDGPMTLLIVKSLTGEQKEMSVYMTPQTKVEYHGLKRRDRKPKSEHRLHAWLKEGSRDVLSLVKFGSEESYQEWEGGRRRQRDRYDRARREVREVEEEIRGQRREILKDRYRVEQDRRLHERETRRRERVLRLEAEEKEGGKK